MTSIPRARPVTVPSMRCRLHEDLDGVPKGVLYQAIFPFLHHIRVLHHDSPPASSRDQFILVWTPLDYSPGQQMSTLARWGKGDSSMPTRPPGGPGPDPIRSHWTQDSQMLPMRRCTLRRLATPQENCKAPPFHSYLEHVNVRCRNYSRPYALPSPGSSTVPKACREFQ